MRNKLLVTSSHYQANAIVNVDDAENLVCIDWPTEKKGTVLYILIFLVIYCHLQIS